MRCMSDAENSGTPYVQSSAGSVVAGSDPWIMKNLNDLRADQKEQNERLDKAISEIQGAIGNVGSELATGVSQISDRVSAVETKINRFTWTVAGVVIAAGVVYGLYELATSYFEISIKPKP